MVSTAIVNNIALNDHSNGMEPTNELEEMEDAFGGAITERNLRRVTGIHQLSSIVELALQIDTDEDCLAELHSLVPNLRHLTLDGGHITSIRSVGLPRPAIARLTAFSSEQRPRS